MSRRLKAKVSKKSAPLPVYITMDTDDYVDIDEIYAPVDVAALVGGPRSQSEILAALPKSDQKPVRALLKDGFKGVLMVDVESGAAGLQLRRYIPPPPPPSKNFRRTQVRVLKARDACNVAYRALEDAIINKAIADQDHHASSEAESRRGKNRR
ncbi:MAG TPA: hypothetical protein VL981_06235 [Candidatus Methylacidiphilales bacterium]|nr:hypothetical protein [Candidatus Methylacidiphilales bacterium]